MQLVCVVLAAIVSLATASSTGGDRVVLEPRQALGVLPVGWIAVDPVNVPRPPTATTVLVFVLTLQRTDELYATVLRVSDPRSPAYGQHLNLSMVDALTGPSPASVAAVAAFLHNHDCAFTQGNGFMRCTLPVAAAEALLDTPFTAFVHPRHPAPVWRAVERHYTVPAALQPHLAFVGNVHRLHALSSPMTAAAALRNVSAVGTTPGVLRKRYNLTATDVGQLANTQNHQAVAQFLGQFFSQADLTEFFAQFGTDFVHRNAPDKIVGPDSGFPGTEASLDIEYIMSTGANISTWFWSTPGKTAGQEPFLAWVLDLANTSTIPFVHSVSYGDDEDSLDAAYMQRVSAEFAKLGARGVSVLVASGDSGAGCSQSSLFEPNFPVSSPWVTAVGGTILTKLNTDEEGDYISGGGFSNVFAQPAFQTAAVANFLATSSRLPKPKLYNATGRAYPDVAACSEGFWVVVDRVPMPGVGGTSCATPTFSGVIAMINDLRSNGVIAAQYQNGGLLFDVIEGCNAGCAAAEAFCAQTGWDPVTGNGSPNFATLSKAVLALQ